MLGENRHVSSLLAGGIGKKSSCNLKTSENPGEKSIKFVKFLIGVKNAEKPGLVASKTGSI